MSKKNRQKDFNYLKGLVICHGKSEIYLAKFIQTKLHLNIKIIGT